jgi:hypothetical protein
MFSYHGLKSHNSPGARSIKASFLQSLLLECKANKYHNRPDFGYQKHTGHGRSSGVFLTIYTSQVGVAGIKQDIVPVSTRKSEGWGRESREEGRGISTDGRVSNERERVGCAGEENRREDAVFGIPSAAARKHSEEVIYAVGWCCGGMRLPTGIPGYWPPACCCCWRF